MRGDESVADHETLATIEAVTDQISKQVADIISWVKTCKSIEFLTFEKQLLSGIGCQVPTNVLHHLGVDPSRCL